LSRDSERVGGRLLLLFLDMLDELSGPVAADQGDTLVVAEGGQEGKHLLRVGDLVSFYQPVEALDKLWCFEWLVLTCEVEIEHPHVLVRHPAVLVHQDLRVLVRGPVVLRRAFLAAFMKCIEERGQAFDSSILRFSIGAWLNAGSATSSTY
jgi:hypothetical protein